MALFRETHPGSEMEMARQNDPNGMFTKEDQKMTQKARLHKDDDELIKPRLRVPVARPRQRRNKAAGHSLECRGRGLGPVT